MKAPTFPRYTKQTSLISPNEDGSSNPSSEVYLLLLHKTQPLSFQPCWVDKCLLLLLLLFLLSFSSFLLKEIYKTNHPGDLGLIKLLNSFQ